jgi:hypothetical protein
MTKQKLNETAGGGATGAGGVAVRTDGPGISGKQRRSLQDYLRKFQKRVVNRYKFAPVTPFPIRLGEAFDLQDVLSRLRGIEGKSVEPRDNVTYGVEDDEGNIMKVTVRKDQAAEFEAVLAHELADIEAFSVTGEQGKDVSMAELLYNLKDKFDIIDVEFPKIPTDVVYNADQATVQPASQMPANDQVTDDQTNLDQGGDMGGDLGAPGMGDDDLGPVANGRNKLDLNDISGEGIDDLEGDAMGGEGEPGDELALEPEGDAEGVEGFEEPPADEGSILDRVLDMLKAQAEAETAKANAEAEKYRADQAEYSARAAQATVAQQEELARMEADMEKQKAQEKQAKKLADIAKYRVQQTSSFGVNESDSGETVALVRKLMAALPQKWEVFPNDDMATRAYKNQQQANEMRELQARMRSARAREIYAKQQREKGQQEQNPNQQQQQQNQRGQQQQPNGQQGNQQQGQQGNPPA